MTKKRQDCSQAGAEDLSLGAAFGQLFPDGEQVSSAEDISFEPESPTGQGETLNLAGRRIRLGIQRVGRAGKTVTVVCGLPDGDAGQKAAKLLKKQLGCGASFQDGELILQGDQRERLRAELKALGASDVK
ncbi:MULTISPECIES: translation initiation factor [Jonquetella]|uniref:Translation initiation factor eIF-1/SUI1-like protein n=1 Tax=Jonquetella anthropi DSM 22815 TaxID=885272 RepID=H0UJU2_9BACT|nr:MULTISPECIES: translation initiation factor [Jonquetella]EEX48701.1 translation initiation factor SUI1 [Jonquetella anthropi E3_33 E1]EHM12951.1 translation initiation factor eIF-1/SUI1-like protein [Jonquetella anthropi DSM 22815]ERL23511.1 translation initiation factor SUI1 [Jonquetella sp. BV3C21]